MIHLSLMCELTTNRLKRFSTRTSLPATHQGSVKVSSKAKHLGCFELTLLKRPLMSTLDNSKSRLHDRGYPDTLVYKVLSEVKFEDRKSAIQQREKTHEKILPFVTPYHPAVPNLKNILMSKWHLIQNQSSLRAIYQEPPITSYKRGKSLKDILVRSKL